MADISFNVACKELEIAQIAQLNQLFQLLHLSLDIYGHGFYELCRMLMRKDVNNDCSSKDSPIWRILQIRSFLRDDGNIYKVFFVTSYSIKSS